MHIWHPLFPKDLVFITQFLFGVSSETADRASVSIEPFTASVKNAVRYIYQAVADPVEGTLLTIVSAWADFINAKRHCIDDFGQLFIDSKATLEKALAETKRQLDVPAKADVVDAGANAFVYFIDGIIECIHAWRKKMEDKNIKLWDSVQRGMEAGFDTAMSAVHTITAKAGEGIERSPRMAIGPLCG